MANAAPTYEPIAAFQLGPTGAGRAKLIRHTDGHFYGVSAEGGANGAGTIFKLSPAGELSTFVNLDSLNGGTNSELVSDGQGAVGERRSWEAATVAVRFTRWRSRPGK